MTVLSTRRCTAVLTLAAGTPSGLGHPRERIHLTRLLRLRIPHPDKPHAPTQPPSQHHQLHGWATRTAAHPVRTDPHVAALRQRRRTETSFDWLAPTQRIVPGRVPAAQATCTTDPVSGGLALLVVYPALRVPGGSWGSTPVEAEASFVPLGRWARPRGPRSCIPLPPEPLLCSSPRLLPMLLEGAPWGVPDSSFETVLLGPLAVRTSPGGRSGGRRGCPAAWSRPRPVTSRAAWFPCAGSGPRPACAGTASAAASP